MAMPADVSPEVMANRIEEFAQLLTYQGMSACCAAGLRPVRRVARRRNYGFTDRTGDTRKSIGPVRRYKISTARRYRSGGAYFRGGGIVGAVLEHRFGGRYKYLAPAFAEAQGAALRAFERQGEKEVIKAARLASNLQFG